MNNLARTCPQCGKLLFPKRTPYGLRWECYDCHLVTTDTPGATWESPSTMAKRVRLYKKVRDASIRLSCSQEYIWEQLRKLTGLPMIVRTMGTEEIRTALNTLGKIQK